MDEDQDNRIKSAEILQLVTLIPNNREKTTNVGVGLTKVLKEKIIQYLRENRSTFAWGPEDMSRIHRMIFCHFLGIAEGYRLVRQKKRWQNKDKWLVIQKDVQKLLEAGFIKEVKNTEWLTNVVMVKKKNGKWRICIDFTNLNKVCPKDCFLLPKIDQLVDTTSRHQLLNLLNAFSVHH